MFDIITNDWPDTIEVVFYPGDNDIDVAITSDESFFAGGFDHFDVQVSPVPDFSTLAVNHSLVLGVDFGEDDNGAEPDFLGLQPGTVYFFRLGIGPEAGASQWSPTGTFATTGDPPPPPHNAFEFRPFWNRKHGNRNARINRLHPRTF